jgi:hypothetical protein
MLTCTSTLVPGCVLLSLVERTVVRAKKAVCSCMHHFRHRSDGTQCVSCVTKVVYRSRNCKQGLLIDVHRCA